jgi:hypothetical protein
MERFRKVFIFVKFLDIGIYFFNSFHSIHNFCHDIFLSAIVINGKKGYQPFTQEDSKTLKMDITQILRKIFSINIYNSIEIKFFEGTAIYGYFSKKLIEKIPVLYKSQSMNIHIPYCIAYTTNNKKEEKRVIVRKFLFVSIYSKNITKGHSKSGSGGKEIGTVK